MEDLLCCGADPNKQRGDGATALYVAADRYTEEEEQQAVITGIIELLLKASKGGHSDSSRAHTSPQSSDEWSKGKLMVTLLESGADMEARTKDGSTPLIIASEEGKPDLVKIPDQTGGHL